MNMDIALHMKEGEWVGIYGPSGAGKTTLLRFMAGLLRPHNGFLRINGETWCDTRKRIFIPPGKRDAAMVFQEFALFPNMTVDQNLAFALKRGEDRRIVRELIEIMQLEALKGAKPDRRSEEHTSELQSLMRISYAAFC